MHETKQSTVKSKINGCQVTMHFTPQSVDGVIENVQSILSNAYDERIQNELSSIVNSRLFATGRRCR